MTLLGSKFNSSMMGSDGYTTQTIFHTLPNQTQIVCANYSQVPSIHQGIQNIHVEMEDRVNNLGYGIGVALNLMVSKISSVASSIAEKVGTFFISKVETFVVSNSTITPKHENIEPMKYQKFSLADKDKINREYPQAVIIQGKVVNPILDENYFAQSHHSFLENLAQRYLLNVFYNVTKTSQICDTINIVNEIDPIKLFIIMGHGSPKSLELDNRYPQGRMNLEDYFLNKVPPQDLRCLDQLDVNAKIILYSCSTGGQYSYSRDSSSIQMNMQTLFAMHALERPVYAPKFELILGTLKIEPLFGVYAHGAPLQQLKAKFHDPAEHLTGLSYVQYYWENYSNFKKEYRLEDNKIDLYFLGDKQPSLGKFGEITANLSNSCSEPMRYYLIKDNCDNAGLSPTEERISACKRAPICKNIIFSSKESNKIIRVRGKNDLAKNPIIPKNRSNHKPRKR